MHELAWFYVFPSEVISSVKLLKYILTLIKRINLPFQSLSVYFVSFQLFSRQIVFYFHTFSFQQPLQSYPISIDSKKKNSAGCVA